MSKQLECPVCGKSRDIIDKDFQMTIYRGVERIAVLPQGTQYSQAITIAKGLNNTYIMQEVLDAETKRLLHTKQIWPHVEVKG